jgi:hypothetical protein
LGGKVEVERCSRVEWRNKQNGKEEAEKRKEKSDDEMKPGRGDLLDVMFYAKPMIFLPWVRNLLQKIGSSEVRSTK